LKRYGVGTLAVVGLTLGSAKLGLSSDYAARQVVARLQAVIGAPIRAGGVDLGFGASALRHVEVLENLTTSEPPPWCSAESVETNLTLSQLLRGDLGGGTVTVRDAAVTLRFDAANHLLTRLPKPPPAALVEWPVVYLKGGVFTLQHEGVPDEVFHNIDLELHGSGEKLTLTGTVTDPDWGVWAVSGGRERADGPFTLVLHTLNEVHATMPLLRRAPFVPPVTWRQVELEGDTTCELTLRFEPDGHVRYRAVLDPHDTKVHVTSIALRADSARGRVVVEDEVLTLEDVRGRAAGGALIVGSTMDFRTLPRSLRFAIEATALNPRLLPPSWRVPALEGQVTGRADLEVLTGTGPAVTRGQGAGTVKMFPLLMSMNIRLEADGRGFHFRFGRG
jgi:hypothetical protein